MLPSQVERAPVLAGERVLPLVPALAAIFPAAGLRRGATVVVATNGEAQGAVSLALALVAEASATGSWCAVVGVPDLGLLAAAELGACLDRVALVPHLVPSQWVTVIGALHGSRFYQWVWPEPLDRLNQTARHGALSSSQT